MSILVVLLGFCRALVCGGSELYMAKVAHQSLNDPHDVLKTSMKIFFFIFTRENAHLQ